MGTTFLNCRHSKTSHRLLLNISNKIYFKRKDKYIALSNHSIYHTWKNVKPSYRHNTFCIRYQDIFWIYLKKSSRKG